MTAKRIRGGGLKMVPALVSVLAIAALVPPGVTAPARGQTAAPSAVPSVDLGKDSGKEPMSAADKASLAASLALLQSQPVALAMVRGPVPWVKTCSNAAVPEDCQATAAFAFDPLSSNSLEISVDGQAKNNSHAITVVLPLDLQLAPGFTFGWGGDRAARGTYATCRKIGCIGTVVLGAKDYDAFRKAEKAAVGFTTLANRNVELQAPLEGMATALDGKAVGPNELRALSEAGVRKHNDMVREYNEKLAKENGGAAGAGKAAEATASAPGSAGNATSAPAKLP